MKPLTRYAHECFEVWGDFSSRMVDDEYGGWYAKDEADAVIRELEAKLAFVESERDSICGVLTAARDILKAELERSRAKVSELEAERDAARADAERLRQDAERMAWIDAEVGKRSCVNIRAENPTPNGWRGVRVFSVSSQHTGFYGSAREAIDAARGAA